MPIPWLAIAQLGTQMLGQFSGARDVNKYQKKQAKKVGRANVISGITQGRFQPQVSDTGPKQSLLTRLAGAASTGLSVADTLKQAARADEMYGLQKRGMEQGLEQGAQELEAGKLKRQTLLGTLGAAAVPLPSEQAIPATDPDLAARGIKLIPQGQRRYEDLLPDEAPDLGYDQVGKTAFNVARQEALRNEQAMQAQARQQAQAAASAEEERLFDRMSKIFGMEQQAQSGELALRADQRAERTLNFQQAQAQATQAGQAAQKGLMGVKDRQEQFKVLTGELRKLPFLDRAPVIQYNYSNLLSTLDEMDQRGFSGVGQIAAMNSFQRLIDEVSVKEGDVALIREAQSYVDQLALQINRAGDDVIIDTGTAQQMRDVSKAIFSTYQEHAGQVADSYLESAIGADYDSVAVSQARKAIGLIPDMGKSGTKELIPASQKMIPRIQKSLALPDTATVLGNIGRRTFSAR